MDCKFIAYKKSQIHYCVWGNGLKPLFCFHGYGEDAESFGLLENTLGADYTIVAIDMPFHGKTVWNEGLNFTADELVEIMARIIASFQPLHSSPKSGNDIEASSTLAPFRGWGLNLFGYSMGGRIALQLLQKIPASIEKLVLAAPDGLHKNPWYLFATQNFLGNKVFKYLMYQPKQPLAFLKFAEKYRLVHPGFAKIVHYYTDDAKERHRLYCRWTTLRKFKPSLPQLKKLIKQHGIPTRLLFGRFDNIILSGRADIFKDDTKNIQIHIIDAGHRLLQAKYALIISQLFYQ